VHEIPSAGESLVAKIQSGAERLFAKKSNRNLEPAEDDAPASEDEPEDDEEEGDSDDEAVTNERLRSSMIAEQRLCELTGKLVLAIIGRVIDASGSKRGSLKKRLLRNKNGLGQNYREVLSYLEERKPRSAPRSKAKQSTKAGAEEGEAPATKKDFKSAERVDEDDDNDEEEEGDNADPVEEDEEEDLRTRGLVEEDIDRENDENEELDDPEPESDEDEVMGD
jgi:cohesin complex subunit SA-1/2